jgi:hypothetical protein
VPEGYFQHLQQPQNTAPATKTKAEPTTVMFRLPQLPLAGFVAIGFAFNKKKPLTQQTNRLHGYKEHEEGFNREINEFVELANATSPDIVKTDTKDEVNNLLKDVSDKEIQDFLNDTGTAETEEDQTLN